MTIASEITRLQNDKAAMCTAIENKWVTVGNVTFDDYAACIDAIPSWWWFFGFNYLVVWGWASWEALSCNNGWWGWWQVFCGRDFFTSDYITIDVWCWGKWWISNYPSYWWWDTVMCYWDICVCSHWWCWASWQTWWSSGSWCGWWWWSLSCAWGWGWWAVGNGWTYSWTKGWSWWLGITYCGMDFWWWGWWGSLSWGSCAGDWCCGWGAGNSDATWCWWGWGWSNSLVWGYGWNWWWWVVLISYPTDWSWGVSCWCWWCVSQCWDYTIHCFTTDWEFFPFDTSSCKHFCYLWVWWGWWWRCISTVRLNWWGGWWEVRLGTYTVLCNEIPITIWAGGNFATDGWDTHIWYLTIRWWKWTWSNVWWASWSSYKWWVSSNCSSGWGWWAGWQWCRAVTTSGWRWWDWICWYWWWWWWGCGGAWVDGWGNYGSNANNYWWGWWGRGKWCQWMVEICYLEDWTCWFTTATWGDSCYTCNWYCVHRFTSDWTFTIVS